MFYRFIRLLTVLSLGRFFDKIVIENREKVPKNRPTIFVANHPNTMMDALLVGYAVGKRIYFIAKSTLFSNKIISWFMMKIGMVPVYRQQDDPTKMRRNEEIFRRLYDLLESGGSFLIFPEGISIPDRMLHRVKTGAARIALGVEEKNDFSLNVQIVPVGLNYSDYKKFRSDVYCRFGKPITVNDFRDAYVSDPIQAVKDLTEKIRKRLERVTTYISEDNMADIVSSLETIYKKELMMDLGMKVKSKTNDFIITKGIIDAVTWFYEHQPEQARKIGNEMRKYLRKLDRLHLRDEFLSPHKKGISFFHRLKAWFFLVLGFPVFLWGIINNFLPYKIPRWYASHFIKQETFVSSVKLVVGIASFVIFYTLQIWLTWYFFHDKLISGLYALSIAPAGNFALFYLRKARNYQQHLIFISLFYRRRILIYNLIQQRMKLIEMLNRAKDEYLSATGQFVSDR